MSTSREIRRAAFQALYQLDARRDESAEAVLESVMDEGEEDGGSKLATGDRKKAFLLASRAFSDRERADAFMREAAPEWPTHRQAAVDRAILRLAFYEMTSGTTPAKVAVNEAVELAKAFSTEKSPAFVNGLLDKALKMVAASGSSGDAPSDGSGGSEGEAGAGLRADAGNVTA